MALPYCILNVDHMVSFCRLKYEVCLNYETFELKVVRFIRY